MPHVLIIPGIIGPVRAPPTALIWICTHDFTFCWIIWANIFFFIVSTVLVFWRFGPSGHLNTMIAQRWCVICHPGLTCALVVTVGSCTFTRLGVFFLPWTSSTMIDASTPTITVTRLAPLIISTQIMSFLGLTQNYNFYKKWQKCIRNRLPITIAPLMPFAIFYRWPSMVRYAVERDGTIIGCRRPTGNRLEKERILVTVQRRHVKVSRIRVRR